MIWSDVWFIIATKLALVTKWTRLAATTSSHSTPQQLRYSKIQWTASADLLLPQRSSTLKTKNKYIPHLPANLPLIKKPTAISCSRSSRPMSNHHSVNIHTYQNHSSSTALLWIHCDSKKFFSFRHHQPSNQPE